ncbi:hydrogenase subunit MbhD domain-containing protein [Dethiosulfovibrio salsuginis]|uniref:Membrane bound hydrogenase subunit mbhD n=1 Tax=Dethiosulfovibrio salsuginis TaxID=561720 RepID=A0A1X7JKE6_9BACT|nr:hydrogenase subunit MbhD domain-containing protein [Dethiosulfovibrio salsuginis]SMG28648.1 Membrane bound hydrogenase subunit mbhD [Dethiosulfovibrio salsuginis]
MTFFHVMNLVLLVVTGFYALWFRDLLYSVISLGAFSLLLSLEFYILQAPDVAIAEAGIGAALNTTVFLFALFGVDRLKRKRRGRK